MTALRNKPVVVSVGVFLLVAAVYLTAGSGRIDIIDGQYRFEVARNLLDDRSIQISDPFLGFAAEGINGVYSPYGVAGSIVSLPLVYLANVAGTPSRDRQQFFFSFTSGVLGAATAAVLFLFYITLGVTKRPAVAWALVAAFATLAFPVAASVFDQVQHGFFVLCACFLAFLSTRRDSMLLAVAGGLALAILVNFQETYVIMFPTLAVATLAPAGASPEQRRRALERGLVFMFVGVLGVLMWASINNFRFGSLLVSGKPAGSHPPPLGNPLIGIPGLLFSLDKSIFLYSPPTVIALLGLRHLMSREYRLGQAVAATSLAYFGMISMLSFYGGDWCWGPRYFASILPLLALGFPFVPLTAPGRLAARTLVVMGLCVQLLALSVDHHRFFYARSLPTFFWYTDRSFYFTNSALFSRPHEVLESIEKGVPAEADLFRPGPYSGLLTYAVFGGWGHPGLRPPEWMRHYKVFWLPRPWPFWMRSIPEQERPIDMKLTETILAAMAAAGMLAIWLGCARGTRATPS
jgi:hypothetical protein